MTKLGKPSVILLRLCRIQKRPKSSHFGLSCDLCSECHKIHLWLSFLILSILSSSTCATAAPSNVTKELFNLLIRINSSFEKSDALLYSYAPTPENEKCKNMSLFCYVRELEVMIREEEIIEEENEIYHIRIRLPQQLGSVNCPPCEAQTLVPATTFHQNFKELLEKRNSQLVLMSHKARPNYST